MPRTLCDLAHICVGNKDDVSCISVITLRPECAEEFALLGQHVTAEHVHTHFVGLACDEVERYVLPQLSAFNFILHGALADGVTYLLALDAHDKSLSSTLLTLGVPG